METTSANSASTSTATTTALPELYPLFIIESKRLIVCSPDTKPLFRANQSIVVLSQKRLDKNQSLEQPNKTSNLQTTARVDDNLTLACT